MFSVLTLTFICCSLPSDRTSELMVSYRPKLDCSHFKTASVSNFINFYTHHFRSQVASVFKHPEITFGKNFIRLCILLYLKLLKIGQHKWMGTFVSIQKKIAAIYLLKYSDMPNYKTSLCCNLCCLSFQHKVLPGWHLKTRVLHMVAVVGAICTQNM